MADRVKKASYCYPIVPTGAGQGARILAELSDAGINLLAYSGFPAGGGRSQLDLVVENVDDGGSGHAHAEALARLAVEETGYGVVADKVQKNLFASRQVYEFIRPMKTVGVVNRHRRQEDRRDRRAVRRRRGDRALDESDIDRDL